MSITHIFIFTFAILGIFIYPLNAFCFVAPLPGNNSFAPQSFNTQHTLPNINGDSKPAQNNNNNANISNNPSQPPLSRNKNEENPGAKNFNFFSGLNMPWLIFLSALLIVAVIFVLLKFKKVI